MPARPVLDADMILAATEDMLRKHGPGKAGVVDVARTLGVSHAAVYRHFPSKDALRSAVIRRWLARDQDELVRIAAGSEKPEQRLISWFRTLLATKQRKAAADPELQATLRLLAAEDDQVGAEYVAGLLGQIRSIVQDGIEAGQFEPADEAATAATLFDATLPFHHFALAGEWMREDTLARLDAVLTLLIEGLRPRPGTPARS